MNTLLIKLIKGAKPTRKEIQEALYEICEDVHVSCDLGCPVFYLEDGCPGRDKPWEENRGCDCFKDGKKMFDFIKSHI